MDKRRVEVEEGEDSTRTSCGCTERVSEELERWKDGRNGFGYWTRLHFHGKAFAWPYSDASEMRCAAIHTRCMRVRADN